MVSGGTGTKVHMELTLNQWRIVVVCAALTTVVLGLGLRMRGAPAPSRVGSRRGLAGDDWPGHRVVAATRGDDTFAVTTHSRTRIVSHTLNNEPWAPARHAAVLQDGPPVVDDDGSPPPPPQPATATAADEAAPVVDVLVVYTTAALAEVGGSVNAMRAIVDVVEQETNEAWASSGVGGTVRVVNVVHVPDFFESANMAADLSRLRVSGDEPSRHVRDLRDAAGADAVVLLERTGTQYCGLSYLQTEAAAAHMADRAFSVVALGCAPGGQFSFGHELGHVLGMNHDRAHSGRDAGLTPTAYGHQWQGRFRSVMAYNDASRPTTRVNRYSSPDARYRGVPTGSDADNNVAAVNSGLARAAAWRDARE